MDQLQRRTSLQTLLETLQGNPNVYFQPPDDFIIDYPCIVYSRDSAYRASADNAGYRYVQRYQVSLISRDPDNPVVSQVGLLPLCTYSRGFAVQGLNHDVFELYY